MPVQISNRHCNKLDDINTCTYNPATAAIGLAAVKETYNNILSPATTGIASGIIPDAVEPIAIAANAGVNNRGAPCTVNVLLAAGAVNICICT